MSTQDLLLQQSNGNLLAWEVSAGSSGFTQLFQLASTQSIGAVGDVNGDGRADLYINSSAGNPLLWVNGGIGGTSFFSAPVAGTVLAIADISGATGGEIITRDGTNIRSYSVGTNGALTQNFSSGTTPFLAGVAADTQVFAGDIVAGGKSELVFVTASGASLYYNGTTFTDLPNTTTGISVVGVADLGFGSGAEILYRNTNIAGSLDGYFVYNATTKTFTDVVGITKGYNVIGLQDVTGDGVAEMIVSNGTQTLTFNTVSKAFENDLTGVANASGITVRGFGNFNGTVAATFSVEQSDNQVKEGQSITYTVKATAPVTKDTTFTFTTAGDDIGGTVDKAAGADLTPASGTVTIKAGQTSATFTVTATADSSNEALEGFRLTLLDNNLKAVGSPLTAIITDNSQSTGQTFTLTTGVNQFPGTAGPDTFDASSANSLQTADVLTGGAGTDSLNALLTTGGTIRPTLTGIEDITITATTTAATLDLASATGVTAVRSQFSTSDLTFTGITDAKAQLEAISNAQINAVDLTYRFANTALAGTADNVALQVNGFGAGDSADGDTEADDTITLASSGSNGIETLTINGTGGNSNFKLTVSAGTPTLVLTGDANITLDPAGYAAKSVDGSKATGSLTFTVGNDGATAAGGAGNDNITAGTGNDNLSGGEGNDTFGFGANFNADDTVNGGGGTDTMSLNAGFADAVFKNVSNLGNLTLATAGASTLGTTAQAAGITRVGGFAGNNTVAASAYTTGLSFTSGTAAGADRITTGSGDDLFVYRSNFLGAGDTISAGTGNDTIRLNNGSTAGTVSASIDLDDITGVETIVVASSANDATVSFASLTDSVTQTITVDGSAMTNATKGLRVDNSTGVDTTAFVITGGAGNDTLAGNDGSDTISGGAGADAITAGAGKDNLSGGAGNDTFTLAANFTADDTISGGDGNADTLSVDAGSTDARFANVTGVEVIALTTAGNTTLGTAAQAAGIVAVTGTTGNDSVNGSAFTVGIAFVADAGNDTLRGGSGNDTFTFTDGGLTTADTIVGGDGTDTIRLDTSAASVDSVLDLDDVTGIERVVVTSAANNAKVTIEDITTVTTTQTVTIDASVLGATKTVEIVNQSTATTTTFAITGGAGADTLAGAAAGDTLNGGAGNDVITTGDGNNVVDAGAGDDAVTGGAGNDNLTGGAGNDTFTMAGNLTLDDTIAGGDGNADVVSTNAGVTLDGAFFNVTGVEQLTFANAGSSVLGARVQSAGVRTVNGHTGADVVNASAFTVGLTFLANGGNDDFTFGSGDDVAVFTNGGLTTADTLVGGSGSDTIRLDNTGASVGAVLDLDDVTGFERVTATTATQNLGLNVEAVGTVNTVRTLTVDVSNLTTGTLLMTNASNKEAVTFNITGGGAADTLVGGIAADTIVGGAGADVITGGTGADRLTGGSGADIFVIGAESNAFVYDTITDLANNDVIRGVDQGNESFVSTKISLSGAAGFRDFLDAAAAGNGATNAIWSWFQFNGNTYLVQDLSTGAQFVANTDLVVEITGLVDLSGSGAGVGQDVTIAGL